MLMNLLRFSLFFLFWMANWCLIDAQSLTSISDFPTDFQGNILAISDADMVASAYGDGILGQVEGIENSLSLIQTAGSPRLHPQIEMSNSVINWPSIIAWHPDRPIAYAVETLRLKVQVFKSNLSHQFLCSTP